jgi:uncharacterized protein (TIRG00374 family)
LGLALFAALVYLGGGDSLDKIVHPHPIWALGSLISVALMVYIFAFRWKIMAEAIAERSVAPSDQFFFYAISSLALGVLAPQTISVIVVRATALVQFGRMTLKRSVFSVLFDKLFDAFYMTIFVWPTLLFLADLVTFEQVIVILAGEYILVSVVLFLNYQMWLRLLQRLVSSAFGGLKYLPVIGKIRRLQSANFNDLDIWRALRRSTVFKAYVLTGAGQVATMFRSWMIAKAVGVDVEPTVIFVGIALAQAGLLLSITPNGLGITDGAWFLLLAEVDVPSDAIAVFLVAHRLFEAIAIGVTWLLVYLTLLGRNRLASRTLA